MPLLGCRGWNTGLGECMSKQSQSMTAEELERLPEDHQRHDLVNGVLTTMPPNSGVHGIIAMSFGTMLWEYIKAHQLGSVMLGTGFIIQRNPDTVRAADISFVSTERLDRLGRVKGYPPYAPDLAVDIIDPWELYVDVLDKIGDWLDAGTRMVLVIDPSSRTVMVHRSHSDVIVLTENDQIDGADVVPGWSLPVPIVFE